MLGDLIVTVAPWVILLTAPVALFAVVCAINRMCVWETRKRIASAYLLIAWGLISVIFALLDFLVHVSPVWWPMALIAGVMFLAIGNTLLFLVDRRANCARCVMTGRKCG